jgi:phosphate starvation-inducible protein PhoH
MSNAQPSRAATKRQQRLEQRAELKRAGGQSPSLFKPTSMEMKTIRPMTPNQELAFEAYDDEMHLFLHGCAGTGKTFISLYMALKEIFAGKSECNRVVIIRTAQSSKDIGFLPGSEKQKAEVYEAPYKALCSELFGRGDAYDILKQRGTIEFHTTSFLRGTTIDKAIIIVDEVQNQRYSEIRTVLTRVGNCSKIILCGDTRQDDLTSERYKEQSGIQDMMEVLNKMGSIETVQFGTDDIVRSGFVREFIIAEYELGKY